MINIKENEKLNMLNHSCAHLLAQAVKHLYPNAKFWVGPVVESGFYYDVDLGDEVIKEVSESLKTISEKGTAGRLGGDEFAIFIEDDLDRDSVKNFARLIRYLLGRIIINKESYPITSTIGIAQYPKNGTTFDELYECCDKALYRGKIKGRDCHIIYDPLLHENVRSNTEVLTEVSYGTGSVSSFIHELVNDLLVDKLEITNIVEISKKISNYFNLDRIVITGIDDVHIVCEKEKTINPKDIYLKIWIVN